MICGLWVQWRAVGFLEHSHSEASAVLLVALAPSLIILTSGEPMSNLLAFNIYYFYDHYGFSSFAINNHDSDN